MKRRRRAQVESLDPERGLVGSLRDGCGVEVYLGEALSPPDGCEEPGEGADHRPAGETAGAPSGMRATTTAHGA